MNEGVPLREVHGLALSCIVARQSRSCVFVADRWCQASANGGEGTAMTDGGGGTWSGPVAIKATAVCDTIAEEASPVTCARADAGVCHPLVYEAALARHIQCACRVPRVGIPIYVDCVRAGADAVARLDALFASSAKTPSPPPRTHARSYPLLVTQFIKGASLGRLFYVFPTLPFSVAVSVLSQLAHLLATLHTQGGIVYGDLKLTNVLVTENMGRVWLVDWASCVRNDTPVEEAARHVAASTTPHVLSPALRAFHALASTPLAVPHTVAALSWQVCQQDVWALGVLSMELLTGQPFQGGGRVEEIVRYVVEAITADDVATRQAAEQASQAAMEALRRWVRETLEGPVRARYASSSTTAALSAESARAQRRLWADATLWPSMVDWIVQLLEPDPLRGYANSQDNGGATSQSTPLAVGWESLLGSVFFRELSRCAPRLMAFAQQAGGPVELCDPFDADDDDGCWWWPEACEEEVGDLTIGL